MREVPVSAPEKSFILKAASENKRLDGRGPDDFRPVDIHFGKDWGSCFVTLGETKVLASVSCEVQEPSATRPNEGQLIINVEISRMAAPHLEGGSRSDLSVHLNRMLDKCLKESKAVDLEALCIVADEKVWVLRVDINVLNHEGNLLDCSALAALAALAHFRRPDVTTDGQDITIHDPAERDPIPITLHHYPVCISFGYMSQVDKVLSDATALEERVADACLVYGVNGYRELCALHLGGTAVLAPKVILRCANKAALRAKELVQTIKNRLAQTLKDRQEGKPIGFASCCELEKITSLSQDRVKIQLGKFRISHPLDIKIEERKMDDEPIETKEEDEKMEEDQDDDVQVVDLEENTAELVSIPRRKKKKRAGTQKAEEPQYGEGGPSSWFPASEKPLEIQENVVKPVKIVQNIDLSGDSDEEEVHVIHSSDLETARSVKTKNARTPAPMPSKKKKGKKNRP